MSLEEHTEWSAVRWGTSTDIGPVHSGNEDSWLTIPPVFVVAGGIGRHLGGTQASSKVVITLREFLSPQRLGSRSVDLVNLPVVTGVAATAVALLASVDSPMSVPGTTLSDLMVLRTTEGPYWLLFSMSDSRTYVVGDGDTRQPAHDHSALQEARNLAAASGAPHVIPSANIMTKALGAGQVGNVKADYTTVPLEDGDQTVICTDGVHGVLSDSRIHKVVADGDGPQGTADRLVQASLEAGTWGDATAVVVYTGTKSRVTLTTSVMSRIIQPVRPASIETARWVPRREGSN